MSNIEIIPLSGRPEDWDQQIERFATKTLFHESAWLDFVLTGHPSERVEYFEILEDGLPAGLFCALKARRGLFHVYGSPLPGRGMYLGPLVHTEIDQPALVTALIQLCRRNNIARLELAHDWLDPAVMRQCAFTVTSTVTHVCPLGKDEAQVWDAMKGTCRTRIRKAEKAGLVAECTDDPAIVQHFYAFFEAALSRRGLSPPYPISQVSELRERLLSADRLFAVWVSLRGTVVGAGFYPHDDRSMYHWDSASDPAALSSSPNELLHWTAMRLAIARGIPTFDIGGWPAPSRFTQKFGGNLMPYHFYSQTFVPLFETGRRLYHAARNVLPFWRAA